MVNDGDRKKKYTRDYIGYMPPMDLGPAAWILDTIVLPVVKKEDASTR